MPQHFFLFYNCLHFVGLVEQFYFILFLLPRLKILNIVSNRYFDTFPIIGITHIKACVFLLASHTDSPTKMCRWEQRNAGCCLLSSVSLLLPWRVIGVMYWIMVPFVSHWIARLLNLWSFRSFFPNSFSEMISLYWISEKSMCGSRGVCLEEGGPVTSGTF